MLRAAAVATAFTICLAGPAGALSEWMGESALNRTFSGKTIEGHYTDGATFIETYEGNGRLSYSDERRQTAGRWSVEAGTFCTIYDIDPSGGCYRVQKVSANFFEFFFAARTVEQAQEGGNDRPSWTARAWIKGEASSCPDQVGV